MILHMKTTRLWFKNNFYNQVVTSNHENIFKLVEFMYYSSEHRFQIWSISIESQRL